MQFDSKANPHNLGDILVELGYCSEEDVRGAAAELERIREMTKDLRLGRILVEHGKIMEAHLEIALARQEARRNGGKIGHASVTRVLQCAMDRHNAVDDSVDKLTQVAGVVLAKANGG